MALRSSDAKLSCEANDCLADALTWPSSWHEAPADTLADAPDDDTFGSCTVRPTPRAQLVEAGAKLTILARRQPVVAAVTAVVAALVVVLFLVGATHLLARYASQPQTVTTPNAYAYVLPRN